MAEPGPYRGRAEEPLVVGAERLQAHDAVGRHEAPGADRQSAVAPTDHPLSRRADRGRRCRAAQGHVGKRAGAARFRRDRHPHHPLHPRGRGHGRPDRRHQSWRADPGRGQGRADAQARQEAAHASIASCDRCRAARACRTPPCARQWRQRAGLHLRYPRAPHRHHRIAHRSRAGRNQVQGPRHDTELARGHLRRSGEAAPMNLPAIAAIYRFEMARWGRTFLQSIVSPVIATSLYFVVFGAAIGSRITEIEGVEYGVFIVPGLVMLTLLTQSVANASFGIYFPRFTGTIYELLSAPIAAFEIVLGYVGAAATKSILLGLVILATAWMFVPLKIAHPAWMFAFLVLTAVTFSLLGFIIGLWADGFEKLQLVPLLIITPLTFLGGTFYSISVLPPFWQTVTLFNPVVYLVSGFRWSFYEIADVSPAISLVMVGVFLAICLGVVWWIFKTGYRLKS